MKLKLDENLPEALVAALAAPGHDADHVHMEGLAGRDDPSVWPTAQKEGRFFITQDLDFSDTRRFQPGTHNGLRIVRLPGAGRLTLTVRIVELFQQESVGAWAGCFVVLSERKLRVLSPGT